MSEEVKYNAIIMEIRAGVGGEEAALLLLIYLECIQDMLKIKE